MNSQQSLLWNQTRRRQRPTIGIDRECIAGRGLVDAPQICSSQLAGPQENERLKLDLGITDNHAKRKRSLTSCSLYA
jgi:hypothetical protein